MEKECVLCKKIINPALSIKHECNHWTHVDCLPDQENPDFENCEACAGRFDPSKPLLPEVEPRPKNGRDYIMNPLEPGMFYSIRKKFSEPHQLLKQQSPIDWMMREHDIGLQTLLAEGVTIDDFLNNGYTWENLVLYKDLEKKNDRSIYALCALKTTIDHFRDYADQLPLKEMTFIKPSHIREYFGLQFDPSDDYLKSPYSDDWTAGDVVELGLTMDNLINDIGMYNLQQYINLNPNEELEKKLRATPKHIEFLKSNEEVPDPTGVWEEHDLPKVYTPPTEIERKNIYRPQRKLYHRLK